MDISNSIDVIKSLADSSRLKVLNSLINKPQYVEELAHRLNLAVSTVSFHLKKLEGAGLVRKTKEQYYIIYYANDDILELTLRKLLDFENTDKSRQDNRIEKYKDKVLKTFFKKNKLVRLPVQRKKRLIVLEEFRSKFKSSYDYSEKAVNEIITELFDDYCTIRRLMIEEGMMERYNQIYKIKENLTSGKDKMIDKKELKKKYKQTLPPMGIYQIKNLVNGKILIGHTKNLNAKFNSYKFQLAANLHSNKYLQEEYNKFGDENFTIEVLDRLEPKEDLTINYENDLITLEELWLEKLKPFNEKGYNKAKSVKHI
jgi:DNA-binding HxlR family transcriptional regulator